MSKNQLSYIERQYHDIINKIKACLPHAMLSQQSDLLFNTFDGFYQVYFTIQVRKDENKSEV